MDRDELRKREDSHLRDRQLDWQYQQKATERERLLKLLGSTRGLRPSGDIAVPNVVKADPGRAGFIGYAVETRLGGHLMFDARRVG